MPHDDNNSLISLINNTLHTLAKLIADLASLAISEAALAKQSMTSILLLLVFLLPLLMIFWFSVIGTCFIGLQWLSVSWQLSFLILSVFNLIILISVIYLLISLKNNLFFNATRRQLKKLLANGDNTPC